MTIDVAQTARHHRAMVTDADLKVASGAVTLLTLMAKFVDEDELESASGM